jgi:phenylacetate-CoA ligase
MLKFIILLYRISPVFIQNLGISLYGFYWKKRRLGGIFKEEVKKCKKRESFSEAEWGAYQTQKLRDLLVYSFQNVPYYNESFLKCGLKLADLRVFELKDLPKLPYLEKEDLRKYGQTTLLSKVKGKGQFYSSSGSTGTPTSIFFSKKFHQSWNALYEVRVRQWAGLNHKMRRGMIGGRRVVTKGQSKPPYYRYNFFEKQVYFSAYHLSLNTVNDYVEGMFKYKIDYLVGYAMSIYFLADFILQKKIVAPQLKAVLTSSEKLTSSMRECIEKAFHCKAFDGYSGVEACGLISENEQSELLFSPDSGILEVLDEKGHQVALGETGEVVSTGLLNFDQPLIRYRIGDTLTLSEIQTSKSKMYMPIIESIEGRIEDVIVGKDGRKMVRFHGLFVDLVGLKSAQIIQHSYKRIEIKLVIDSVFKDSDLQIIQNRLVSQIGEIQVFFTKVDDLQRTKNGKIKAVISHVKF